MFFTIGVQFAGASSIATALNFLVTIITMRAPGMSFFRLPLLVWANFSTSLLVVIATPFIAASQFFVLLDRALGFTFFRVAGGAGGDDRKRRKSDGDEYDRLSAERRAHPTFSEADQKEGREEAERQDRKLDAGEGGQPGEREEGEREERRRARPAEAVCRFVAGAALRDDLGERGIREEPGDRQRALGENA